MSTHSLFDADAATVSDLSARRRARTSVREAQVEAAYEQAAAVPQMRARIESAYWLAGGDWKGRMRALAAAAQFDKAHPGEPSLFEALNADHLFGAQYTEAA